MYISYYSGLRGNIMIEEDNKYNFLLRVESALGENVEMRAENVIHCPEIETELEMYLNIFERFLQAVSFVIDGMHLELVED